MPNGEWVLNKNISTIQMFKGSCTGGGMFKLRFDWFITLSCPFLLEGIWEHTVPLNLVSQKRSQHSRLGGVYSFGEK